MLEFNLPTNEISLSTIFEVLQRAQIELSLQDYSVSQTTFDQVRFESCETRFKKYSNHFDCHD